MDLLNLEIAEATLIKSPQHGYQNGSLTVTMITHMLKWMRERQELNPTQRTMGNQGVQRAEVAFFEEEHTNCPSNTNGHP